MEGKKRLWRHSVLVSHIVTTDIRIHTSAQRIIFSKNSVQHSVLTTNTQQTLLYPLCMYTVRTWNYSLTDYLPRIQSSVQIINRFSEIEKWKF